MKKVMLFVGAVVLTLTTAVSAQCPCGWVLWQRSDFADPNKVTVWTPKEGMDTYRLCVVAADIFQKGYDKTVRELPSETAVLWQNSVGVRSFVCLPSNVDPREKEVK